MTQDIQRIWTPVGRLVMGHTHTGYTKDAEGRPLVSKKTGEPRTDYFAAIAIDKNDPTWPDFHRSILSTAKESFPNFFQGDQCIYPAFAFKIIDGDSTTPNRAGKVPCEQPGYKGCWIVSMSSGFPSPTVADGGNRQVLDKEEIKLGYYIRAMVSIRGNGSTNQPGIFINHSVFELVGYGPVINRGLDASAAAKAAPAPAYIPPGMTAAPVAAPDSGPYDAAPAGVGTPAPAFVPPQGPPPGPAPQGGPPVPPAPDTSFGVLFDVQGQGYTREQLEANGWSEAQILALPRFNDERGDRIPF